MHDLNTELYKVFDVEFNVTTCGRVSSAEPYYTDDELPTPGTWCHWGDVIQDFKKYIIDKIFGSQDLIKAAAIQDKDIFYSRLNEHNLDELFADYCDYRTEHADRHPFDEILDRVNPCIKTAVNHKAGPYIGPNDPVQLVFPFMEND